MRRSFLLQRYRELPCKSFVSSCVAWFPRAEVWIPLVVHIFLSNRWGEEFNLLALFSAVNSSSLVFVIGKCDLGHCYPNYRGSSHQFALSSSNSAHINSLESPKLEICPVLSILASVDVFPFESTEKSACHICSIVQPPHCCSICEFLAHVSLSSEIFLPL